MSVILLSLLLIILVGLGGLMARKTAEHFSNPPSDPVMEVAVVEMSPALANLLNTPNIVATMNGTAPPQVDPLKREQEVIAAASQNDDDDDDYRPKRKPSKKQKCPKCPDMSQYVRLDEVPCWNCTLP
jgi:hypothetical protein